MGRYSGLTLTEIRERFDVCVADPSMRSVSAVLRITREQLEARGHLGAYPVIFAGAAAITAAAALAGTRLPPAIAEHSLKIVFGGAAATLALGYGTWNVRLERRAALAQEREIRRLAAETLVAILKHDFKRKPLLREQEQTLRDLMRREPRPELERLLHDV
jgi:hypothetical protein